MLFTRRHILLLVAAAACMQACSERAESDVDEPLAMNLPHEILPDLAWSFQEPLPGDISSFIAALRAYGSEVNSPVSDPELQTRLPLSSIDIEYTYAKEIAPGKWKDVPATVRIRRSSPPTYAELLFELHTACGENLQDQDHSYFEGLSLLNKENEKGIPMYGVLLGS